MEALSADLVSVYPRGQQTGGSVICGAYLNVPEGAAEWWKFHLRTLSHFAAPQTGGNGAYPAVSEGSNDW